MLKRIEEIFTRDAPIIELVVRGRAIGTTAEHPFYVVEQNDFVAAGEISLELPGNFLSVEVNQPTSKTSFNRR